MNGSFELFVLHWQNMIASAPFESLTWNGVGFSLVFTTLASPFYCDSSPLHLSQYVRCGLSWDLRMLFKSTECALKDWKWIWRVYMAFNVGIRNRIIVTVKQNKFNTRHSWRTDRKCFSDDFLKLLPQLLKLIAFWIKFCFGRFREFNRLKYTTVTDR